jgi:uncharacterized membrane protein
MANTMGKREAQQRVDRIHAFRSELEQLIREGVINLPDEQRNRLDSHYNQILSDLAKQFDVDVSESQKQFSIGMRIASTLGGLAFCAAIVLFFYRYWGLLATSFQVGILISAPILGLIAMEVVARKERTLYYTGLLGLVVYAAFILNLTVLGSIFNIVPSPNAFLAWGIFGLVIAYTYNLRLLLVGGLISLACFCAATVISWTGAFFGPFVERPESFLVLGLVIVAIPLFIHHRKAVEFPAMYRLVGLLFVFLSLLVLGHVGELSALPLSKKSAEAIYQTMSFGIAGIAIWLGIRSRLQGTVNLSSAFFAIYLFWRLSGWWWDWMPKYLFFFIIGVIALLLLAIFRKLRQRMSGGRS